MQNERLKTDKFSGQRTAFSEQKKYSIYDPVLMDIGADVPAIVDLGLALKLGCVRWHKDGRYVKSSGGHYLHRVVKIIPKGKVIHHCDQDPLNNQLYNLEIKTSRIHSQRHRAKNELIGIYRNGKRYGAEIGRGRHRKFYLGTYDTPAEAGMVYDWAARILHGDGCLLNFPDRICMALAAFLIRSSGGKSFDVTFFKRSDGSQRTMRCHIDNPPGPYSSSRLGLIVVREDGCLGYKAIPVDGITHLTIGRKKYTVEQEQG